MGERATRIVENESLFRDVNERVLQIDRDHLHGVSEPDDLLEVFCECGNAECMDKVTLTAAEYEHVREDPIRFLVVPGHEIPLVERIVERNDRFAVVEKELAQDVAVRSDPRRTWEGRG